MQECRGGNQGGRNRPQLDEVLVPVATRMIQEAATELVEPVASLREVDNLFPFPGYVVVPPVEEAGTPWAGTEVGILRSQGRASQTASSGDQILQPVGVASCSLGLAEPGQLEPLP